MAGFLQVTLSSYAYKINSYKYNANAMLVLCLGKFVIYAIYLGKKYIMVKNKFEMLI